MERSMSGRWALDRGRQTFCHHLEGALIRLGYSDEAQAWRDWLTRAIAGSPQQAQILYGVAGERWLPEVVIPWLPGYAKSSPVRVGNAASTQTQFDVFGEVAD